MLKNKRLARSARIAALAFAVTAFGIEEPVMRPGDKIEVGAINRAEYEFATRGEKTGLWQDRRLSAQFLPEEVVVQVVWNRKHDVALIRTVQFREFSDGAKTQKYLRLILLARDQKVRVIAKNVLLWDSEELNRPMRFVKRIISVADDGSAARIEVGNLEEEGVPKSEVSVNLGTGKIEP